MASKQSKKKAVKKVATKPPAAKKKRKKRKKQTAAEAKKNYVNAKDFFNEICEYYKTDVIPDHLAESVYKIAVGLSFAPNFINYSYKDDMVGDAVVKMFAALKFKKFNIDTGNNPFSYFTTIAFHAFINRIKKEKKHRETISSYQEAMYSDEMTEAGSPIYIDNTGDSSNSND
tara:strand:+ start:62 stop:580 length:519 start_codon:yes stop_codon:yes gene_type:complete